MVSEVNQVLQNVLKAEKTMLFLLNKEIDMLYSLSTGQEGSQNVVGQFTVNSIRMKSNLGLAGKVSIDRQHGTFSLVVLTLFQ